VVANDSISALLLKGRGSMEVAVSHGCSPIGLERVITRTDGGWVHEIDGQPAWSVFKEYLDGDPEDLNAEGIVHLCIGQPLDAEAAEEYAPYVIRTPLSLDKGTGALFFPGGGLRSDQPIQLTRRDPARIKDSARACARRILDKQPDLEPALVLQFDCAGRGCALFGAFAAEQIVRPLQETLGTTTPWLGFHTYGEIAPINEQLHYHNYTVVLCAVYDAE
ncbi:MAG: FIST C-terminal domain-containing protein, partial [Planctomycetota bacterium]